MHFDEMLNAAHTVCVLTGAGVSAESGIPTFRDAQTGFWKNFDPTELATPEAFRRHPARVWAWYAMRRTMAGSVEPNAAHRALAALESRFERFTLVTQNVDNLHSRAGSSNVLEIHGNILRARCASGCIAVHRDDESALSDEVFAGDAHADETDPDRVEVPSCPRCGDLFRPDVVWFGEMLPARAIERAFEHATACDLFLLIGTSAEVYPAAGLPEAALQSGAKVVEINPKPSAFAPRATLSVRQPAAEFLAPYAE